MIRKPMKSVKNLPPCVLWNGSHVRCFTFVPDFPPQRKATSALAPAFVPCTKHWRRDGNTSAAHSSSPNDEPNALVEERT